MKKAVRKATRKVSRAVKKSAKTVVNVSRMSEGQIQKEFHDVKTKMKERVAHVNNFLKNMKHRHEKLKGAIEKAGEAAAVGAAVTAGAAPLLGVDVAAAGAYIAQNMGLISSAATAAEESASAIPVGEHVGQLIQKVGGLGQMYANDYIAPIKAVIG